MCLHFCLNNHDGFNRAAGFLKFYDKLFPFSTPLTLSIPEYLCRLF